MVRRIAKKGANEGGEFWGCSRFPQCWGTRAISEQTGETQFVAQGSALESNVAGESAQALFERRLAEHRIRARAVWPVIVGITIVLMVLAYLIGLSVGAPWLGASAAALVVLAMLYAVVDRPQFIDSWRIGAEGERRSSVRLADLEPLGFIVLHDRQSPGYGGNIDHLAIGPTGVWAVETKSLAGAVDLTGGRLSVNGKPQDKIVAQVYREATAVQIALRDVLGPAGIVVAPVLCLHRARLPFLDREIQGVRLVDGRSLSRTIRSGDAVLSADSVAEIAAAAERILPKARLSRK